MRKIIISFCILLSALSLQAQSVSGIRIDGGNTPILVYFGGNQMCLPTTTCFVANLDRGYHPSGRAGLERGEVVQRTCLLRRKRCERYFCR